MATTLEKAYGPVDHARSQHRPGVAPHSSHTPVSVNVGDGERLVSVSAGAILTGIGLTRRDLPGLLIAGLGSALVYRGVSGHCDVYESMNVDTANSGRATSPSRRLKDNGVHVIETFLINKTAEELYSEWRQFERLPNLLSHLKSVREIDDKRSEWIAEAPGIIGGEIRWESELIADEPGRRIAWQTVEGSSIEHRGIVTFEKAPGDRGTYLRVDLRYLTPAGQVGEWIAWLLGQEPKEQIRSDLRKFKNLMETGEIPTIEGQPHGLCSGFNIGRLLSTSGQ